jgi:hypothetical protein
VNLAPAQSYPCTLDPIARKEVIGMSNADIKQLTLWLSLIGTAAWAMSMLRQVSR